MRVSREKRRWTRFQGILATCPLGFGVITVPASSCCEDSSCVIGQVMQASLGEWTPRDWQEGGDPPTHQDDYSMKRATKILRALRNVTPYVLPLHRLPSLGSDGRLAHRRAEPLLPILYGQQRTDNRRDMIKRIKRCMRAFGCLVYGAVGAPFALTVAVSAFFPLLRAMVRIVDPSVQLSETVALYFIGAALLGGILAFVVGGYTTTAMDESVVEWCFS